MEELTLREIYKLYALRCIEEIEKKNSNYEKISLLRDLFYIAAYFDDEKKQHGDETIINRIQEIEEKLMNF